MGKLAATLAIALGELASIYAEMEGAQLYSSDTSSSPSRLSFAVIRLGVLMMIGALVLLAGYMLGLKTFKNIWIVSTVSITSILVLEPLLAYAVTRQLPTTGALVGFALGVIGLLVAIVF